MSKQIYVPGEEGYEEQEDRRARAFGAGMSITGDLAAQLAAASKRREQIERWQEQHPIAPFDERQLDLFP